ncbi:MAG TPA: response regulator transcription factor [Candidatus Paceibacterota bacterium]
MRALVVDDEEELRDILADNLRRECFAVDTASDGTEASYMARTNEYDIILLDNMLPEKAGSTVCMEIRRAGKTVPILMLSILNDSWQKVMLLNAGADDYLNKPYSFDELMARVRALLRRPKEIIGDVATIDDLTVNMKQQSVKRGERNIYLTRKQFTFLAYLIRNEGSVLSRAMIFEHVWDMESDLFSNTIESHIRCLRKKLNAQGEKELIHTVPGRGYRFGLEPY